MNKLKQYLKKLPLLILTTTIIVIWSFIELRGCNNVTITQEVTNGTGIINSGSGNVTHMK